ncbi:hypothetical protein [Nonomuraea fuscirosea]|uniref:hypothetical protein n=1 Tax=Nonomuraea fuscirosea TaxID=1291556 RepID=UPI0033F900F0
MTSLLPAVVTAVAEVEAQFSDKKVEIEPDGSGGAYIVINGINPGPAYTECESWLGFHISPLYPDADTYPLYLRADLTRVDGAAHTPPIVRLDTPWRERPALQVSRSTKGCDPLVDTPALKAMGVIAWLAAQ